MSTKESLGGFYVIEAPDLVHTAGAHSTEHGGAADDATTGVGLAEQLARLLVDLLPHEPEPRALLGLILLTDARGPARTDPADGFVLLPEQDRSRWDRRAIREGLALTTDALRAGPTGRFGLQAGIAGLHAVAPSWADTDWAQMITTYDALLVRWPSPVVALNRVAARSHLPGADLRALLVEVDQLASDLPDYPCLPVVRADLLARLGAPTAAVAAYDQALRAVTDPAQRRLLLRRRDELTDPPR